jgi:hypothetical protein
MWAPVYRDQGHRVAPQGLMSSLADICHNNPVRQASVSASVRNASRCLSDSRFGVCPMVQRLRRRRMHPGVQRDYRKDHTNLNKAGHLPIKLRYPQILWIDCGFPCGNFAPLLSQRINHRTAQFVGIPPGRGFRTSRTKKERTKSKFLCCRIVADTVS